jgi:hypothetical protein
MKSMSTIQMALFTESPAVPHWSDLDEPTRVEVVKLLAQLLVAVSCSPLAIRRANDE